MCWHNSTRHLGERALCLAKALRFSRGGLLLALGRGVHVCMAERASLEGPCIIHFATVFSEPLKLLSENTREKDAWLQREKEPERQIALHALESISEHASTMRSATRSLPINGKYPKLPNERYVNTSRVGVFAFGLPEIKLDIQKLCYCLLSAMF